MDKDKLESLLRNMLSELQKLTTQAHNLRMRATEIDQRVIELQHGIARLAHHGRAIPSGSDAPSDSRCAAAGRSTAEPL